MDAKPLKASASHQYCKLFVRGPQEPVADLILRTVSGSLDGMTVIGRHLEFDVRRNRDAPLSGRVDFQSWPTFVDIEPNDQASDDQVVASVDSVLRALWDTGIPAVAACDFESQLSWDGGIARLRVERPDEA